MPRDAECSASGAAHAAAVRADPGYERHQRLRAGDLRDQGSGDLGRFSPLLGHDGQTFGYDSFILYSPRQRLAIVALGNTSTSAAPVRRSPADSESMELLGGKLLKAIAP